MKLRRSLMLIVVLGFPLYLAPSGSFASPPNRILKVDAQAPKALETLLDLGLRLFGQTNRFYLVEDSPGARSFLVSKGLAATPLSLVPGLPIYLVYLPNEQTRAEVASVASELWTEDGVLVVQMDEWAARKVAGLRCELVRLPDDPHSAYLPSVRAYPMPSLPDTFIQRLVNKVNQDSIRSKIQRLQDFHTRFAPTESCRAAEQYVFNYFTALGLDSVVFDSCYWGQYLVRNVVGTFVGRGSNPRHVAIICGHLDCIPADSNLAPGAEDNASGSAMVLEAARVFSSENFDLNVKFIAIAGEEGAGAGSDHYARLMRGQNVDLIGVLNFDMVAWYSDTFGVQIVTGQASLPLAQLQEQMAAQYTTLAHRITIDEGPLSDDYFFRAQGYSGTCSYEYGPLFPPRYPYYHTARDSIQYLSMPLAAEMAKMGVATLATLALSTQPAYPDDFVLRDVGIGGSLEAAWRSNPEPDLAGYKLLWGISSRAYTDSATLGRVTSHRITGLQNGTRYYAALVAFDSTGNESNRTPERSAVPGIVPVPPTGLAGLPLYFGMHLTWRENVERDLAGYNLYRSTVSGGNYQKLNSLTLPDTVYRDSSLLSDTMYYYVVTAVDTSRNESGYSVEGRGKPITLDQGILLVDETRNGTGVRGSPNDAQQDAFYHAMLQGSRYRDWDVTLQGVPLVGDIGSYSTIVWHADDFNEQLVYPALSGLAYHLSFGGRLWFVGWKPIYGLMNRLGSYPYTFSTGQFPYDYLHLSRSTESPIQDFIGATGLAGYPSVSVDSLKVFAVWQGRLPNIDAVFPRDADTIFTFNSASGDTFQGKPVGVRWLSGPYRIVFFGFPFYFMKDQEARQVAVKVLQDLGEPVGVEAGSLSVPLTTTLLPVHPNPFRGSARIEYSLAEKGKVRLSVYNVVGQLVRELVNAVQVPGRYSAFWDGRDRSGRKLPIGVFLYRLEASDKSWVRKAILLR